MISVPIKSDKSFPRLILLDIMLAKGRIIGFNVFGFAYKVLFLCLYKRARLVEMNQFEE